MEKGTLCWDCKNATNSGCPWSRDFKEVDGWNAKKVKVKINGDGKHIDTFRVKECPLFQDDSHRELRIKFREIYIVSPEKFYFLLRNGYIGKNCELLQYVPLAKRYSKYRSPFLARQIKKFDKENRDV